MTELDIVLTQITNALYLPKGSSIVLNIKDDSHKGEYELFEVKVFPNRHPNKQCPAYLKDKIQVQLNFPLWDSNWVGILKEKYPLYEEMRNAITRYETWSPISALIFLISVAVDIAGGLNAFKGIIVEDNLYMMDYKYATRSQTLNSMHRRKFDERIMSNYKYNFAQPQFSSSCKFDFIDSMFHHRLRTAINDYFEGKENL